MKDDVGELDVNQMVLRSIDNRLKRIEKVLGGLQEDVDDLADGVDAINEVIGLLEPVGDDDDDEVGA